MMKQEINELAQATDSTYKKQYGRGSDVVWLRQEVFVCVSVWEYECFVARMRV